MKNIIDEIKINGKNKKYHYKISDCIKKFLKGLKEHAMNMINYKEKEMTPLTNKEVESYIKGVLRPILSIDVNTHNDRKQKIMKIYLKKLFFENALVFIVIFYRYYYPCYFIYSDCMGSHVCAPFNNFFIVYRKKLFISIKSFFCRPWFLSKEIRAVFHI